MLAEPCSTFWQNIKKDVANWVQEQKLEGKHQTGWSLVEVKLLASAETTDFSVATLGQVKARRDSTGGFPKF